MAFRCPQCFSPGSLEIDCSIELPPDRQSDEISVQVIACSACVFQGLAVYSEGRGSVPESERWQHIGYWVSADAIASVRAVIQSCPDPQNRTCTCPAHTGLGAQDYHGLWKGLLEIERGHTFLMRLHIG
jgi:hypothetical protein